MAKNLFNIELMKTMVQSALATDVPTQARIREIIKNTRPAFPDVTDKEVNDLIIKIEEIHDVSMSEGAVLKEIDFEPWLDITRSQIEFYYWDRYRSHLNQRGMSGQVLGGIGNISDRILGLLENPGKLGHWDRRGMVLGNVQSGKTANYIGVLTKAADAGYRVIVVIAGLQNKLRNQTQVRVDQGFIGFSNLSSGGNKELNRKVVGVGRFDSRRQPVAFTTAHRDFHKNLAASLNLRLNNLTEPAVFVIKKNSSTLRNLIDWLRIHNASSGRDKIEYPMLLIDDEADNASINIKYSADEISTINGQIRELLNLFERSCYVGYTATPFANIFIDPKSDDEMVGQDLFPRDFIVSLEAPSNYFGPSKVFNHDAHRVLNNLEDYENLLPTAHKKDYKVNGLPNSLCEAVRSFIVVRALRLFRQQTNSHNSMLVNVSFFTDVQRQVKDEIHSLVEQIRSSVRIYGAMDDKHAMQDPEIFELRQVFNKYFQEYCTEQWIDVKDNLHESVSAISVVEVNSRSSGNLDYSDYETNGLNVIAVGGLSLSRGLTLEGLSVSYILRRSMMYDTLFQMGRWFGYRIGYEDLCRVWMPEEAQGWYTHIADSIDELRDEVTRMQNSNATPREFGLKVRSHPATLIITAKNKIGTGQNHPLLIGLANRFVETAILRNDEISLGNNLNAVEWLSSEMIKRGKAPADGVEKDGGRLVTDVTVDLIDEFLEKFVNHQASSLTAIDPVRQFINARSTEELKEWDVLFAGIGKRYKTSKSLVDTRLGFSLVCQRRNPGSQTDSSTLWITNKQRVSSRGVERVGIAEKEARYAESKYVEKLSRPNMRKSINYPDYIYRKVRKKPLFIVHLLAIGEEDDDLSNTVPVVAWSISFPLLNIADKKVEYVVNTTWYEENYGIYEKDDEDEIEYTDA